MIDSDLASNNGGWQWSASTGTDPQPYFRVFNPISQSQKVCVPDEFASTVLTAEELIQADPTGNYIRYFVPELAKLTGKGRLHSRSD